jgi:hypothetical protein
VDSIPGDVTTSPDGRGGLVHQVGDHARAHAFASVGDLPLPEYVRDEAAAELEEVRIAVRDHTLFLLGVCHTGGYCPLEWLKSRVSKEQGRVQVSSVQEIRTHVCMYVERLVRTKVGAGCR